jgi:hypothetical protein
MRLSQLFSLDSRWYPLVLSGSILLNGLLLFAVYGWLL